MSKSKTYNKALDLMLAAVLAMKEGKHAQCAKYINQASEDESLDDAIDLVDAVNEQSDEVSAEDELAKALSSVASTKGTKAKAGAEGDDAEDEDTALEEVESDVDGDEESASDLDDTSVVESRLARARTNRAALAKITSAAAKSKAK